MRRETWLGFGVIILVLAALVAKSMLLWLPPVHAGPGQFDAQRAKARLAFVLGDQHPHPADSAADDAVRARLVATLRRMSLKPVVRDQFACNDVEEARFVTCARVRNVIATLGPAAGKALLLSAHYDSVPVGPGASDDGIGVATLLEVGSILKDRPLKRPVILLFNEGEELGLIGARAFLADSLSRNVDSLLNFEARGVTGPVTMFEINQPNGASIDTYASAVAHPNASSLSTDVARLIPNDTDVTTYKERGWLTLNSAIVGNETHYHSPGDDLASLDIRSLQAMGDEGLALASKLSAGAPPAQANRIFFDLSEHGFVQMPLLVGAVCLLVLFIAFAAIAWRRGALIRGTAVVLGALVAAGVAAWLVVTVVATVRAGAFWRAHPEISFVAIYATGVLAELAILLTVGAKLGTRELRAAYWFLFLLIGAALALAAPGGIIYFLVPAVIVLIGFAAARRWPSAETIGGIAGVLFLYLSWGELLAALEELFSPGPLWIVAPVAAIMIAPVLIEAHGLFRRASRRALLLISLGIALLSWIVAGTAPAYSKDRQQRFTIEHVTSFPSRRSYWSVLNDGAALPKAYQSMARWHWGKLPSAERLRWLAPAPPAPDIQAPAIQLLESVVDGSEHMIRVRLNMNGAERIALIAPEDAHIRTAGVSGFVRPIGNADSSGKFTIICTGRSCDGAELSIDLLTPKPVTVTLVGSRNGLPATAAPLVSGRPGFARPQYTPDETVTISRVNL
ncbi:MAG TPA: M20/M25/M40 family metallo-hydrolase [Sphingomicrobium sp.]|nr:M20/M25/M40 family metallo-hydrolase [Sphingomicrobium sp.]